jgi:hypothetical protein
MRFSASLKIDNSRTHKNMFKAIRITLLLLTLIIVAGVTWMTKHRATSWDSTLYVAVYPINADGSAVTAAHMAKLSSESFKSIATFMKTEAVRNGVSIDEPVRVLLGSEVKEIPPAPPMRGNVFSVMMWSLKLRYWASSYDKVEGIKPNIRLFALYHDPARAQVLQHSLGLEKGMIGVAHVFASARETGSNNIVLAHEMLHTLGATDKYDLANNLPIYPDGYAEPALQPRYPQNQAELMAGRTPVSASKAEMPEDLSTCMIGQTTARELRWLKRSTL